MISSAGMRKSFRMWTDRVLFAGPETASFSGPAERMRRDYQNPLLDAARTENDHERSSSMEELSRLIDTLADKSGGGGGKYLKTLRL